MVISQIDLISAYRFCLILGSNKGKQICPPQNVDQQLLMPYDIPPGADKVWNLKLHISWCQVKRFKNDPILRPNDLLSGSTL